MKAKYFVCVSKVVSDRDTFDSSVVCPKCSGRLHNNFKALSCSHITADNRNVTNFFGNEALGT